MHCLPVSMETSMCSVGRRVIHEQVGLASGAAKDVTV